MSSEGTFDYIVAGAGSAGCAVAWQLANADCGTVAVLEAGISDRVPQVKVPFGLLFVMGSRRDWDLRSSPQAASADRSVKVPRGKMLGGSSSINSMAWFRGRRDDFDNWNTEGWRWTDVEPAFDAVEALLHPQRLPDPHPMSEAFGRSLGSNDAAPPTPERESAGVFHVNMRNGARWSAADAFLRPAERTGRVTVITQADVDRLEITDGKATGVHLKDGRYIGARKEIVLSCGSLGSPEILLRSGIGPADQLQSLNIPVVADSAGVGANLHDHPAVGIHFAGENTGYGLTLNQYAKWALSPFNWLVRRKGRMASNFVEAGAFFRTDPNTMDMPDVQAHFFPFMMGFKGSAITTGSGYFADVCVSRPYSRGQLTLEHKDGALNKRIDLGLFNDERDLETLVNGWKRLRALLTSAPFERKGIEVYPGPDVASDEDVRNYVRTHAGTAYHPVGTVQLGDNEAAPLDTRMRVKGIGALRVADASVMPKVTSANTNAPSMMIGYRAGQFIIDDAKAAV